MESSDEDHKCTKKGKSNYFQTEFTVSITKRPEEIGDSGSCKYDDSYSSRSKESDGDYIYKNNDKRKVSISVQADSDIIIERDASIEGKRCVRPPLEGQASTSNDNKLMIPSVQEEEEDSDDEIIEGTRLENSANFISKVVCAPRQDYVADKGPEEVIQSDGRGPSPASISSLASLKPLEWDSGADVGYFHYSSNDPKISTLERMTLGGLTRSDPEGTPCVAKQPPPLPSPVGQPDAESVPSTSVKSFKIISDTNDVKQYPLFPEVVIKQHEVSDSEVEVQIRKDGKDSKKCTSFENINDFQGSATFPRSQSQNNISVEPNPRLRQLIINKSNSSSSVATVVSKNKITKVQSQKQTEKQTSDNDSVQTAANSFEYLPGDKYEHSSDSPNLKRDVERGVKLLGEFMEGAGAVDTISKRQLLKQVVDCLLNKRYPEDEEWEREMFNDGPRLALQQNRDDVSGQSAAADEHSRDSVLTPKDKSVTEASSVYQTTSSSTSHDVRGSSSRKKSDQQAEFPLLPPLPKTSSAPPSGEISRNNINPYLLRYLSSERENQLEWIKKEINHLSNLKMLLEKHETLKKNFTHLKNMKETKTKAKFKPSDTKPMKMPYHKIRKELPKSYSAPLQSRKQHTLEKDISDQSWNSHGYESKIKGLLKRNVSTNTGVSVQKEIAKPPSKSIAYTIVFHTGTDKENYQDLIEQNKNNCRNKLEKQNERNYNTRAEKEFLIADREELQLKSRERVKDHLTNFKLQDKLITKKPDYVIRAESRRQVVAELTALREVRQQNKDRIIASALGNDQPQFSDIPPNPLVVKRVLSQKEMRHLTEKTYKKSSDVKQKVIEQKRKQDYQKNRLMADLFTRKLQRKVLGGQTDLSNSVNVISTF